MEVAPSAGPNSTVEAPAKYAGATRMLPDGVGEAVVGGLP